MLIGSLTSPETSIICIPSHPEHSEIELWLSFLLGSHLLCQQVSPSTLMCPHWAECGERVSVPGTAALPFTRAWEPAGAEASGSSSIGTLLFSSSVLGPSASTHC